MKNKIVKIIHLSLIALSLLMFTLTAIHPVSAAPRDKKSAKLKKRMTEVAPTSFVDVIVKPTASWTNSLTTDLNGRGAVLKNAFTNFAFKVYRIKKLDIDAIAARADVDYLVLDDTVKTLGHLSGTTGAQAIRNLNGTSNQITGAGVGIVVVDSGVDAAHSSLMNDIGSATRVIFSKDFTGENRTDDPYGHGTHVAGMAAGNSSVSQGSYQGIAPKANIINLRVLNGTGTGSISSILAALDWIYTNRANTTYNMKVVNLSLGANAIDSYSLDPLCLAVRKLVDAGIVVVAAAGNEGKDENGNKIYGQIHSPGNEPSALTVGAVNTFGSSIRSDDVVASYSSRGPTRSFYTDTLGVRHFDNLVKPDLVAPGNKIISAQSYPDDRNNLIIANPSLDVDVSGNANKDQMYLSGTSMATPAVAGAVALMYQVNPKLTPNLVKTLLMYSAQTIKGANQFEQGAGLLNIDGAARLAKVVRQDLTALTLVGSPLLTTTAPAPQSTIAYETFTWGQGVNMGYTFATGSNLITKYH